MGSEALIDDGRMHERKEQLDNTYDTHRPTNTHKPTNTCNMQAPVPIRALKVLKSNRFVLGQTVLSRQYIEVCSCVCVMLI